MIEDKNIKIIYDKFYQTIDKEIFYKIISLDPTSNVKNGMIINLGKYSKWLLNAYRSNKIKDEDFYKITECLDKFDKNKKLNLISKDKKDINSYSSFGELLEINNKIMGNGKPTCSGSNIIVDRYHIINNNAKIEYEDDNWLIVTPRNFDGAEFYSKNSNWCTKNKHTFDSYNSSGDLNIIINKNNIKIRYQLHRGTKSFADINDKPITYSSFMNKYQSSLSHLFTQPSKIECEIAELRGLCHSKQYDRLKQSQFLKAIKLGFLDKYNPYVQKRLWQIEQQQKRIKLKKSKNKFKSLKIN